MGSRARRVIVAAVAVAAALAIAAPAASQPPEGARWTEHYFPSGDGVNMLHADVLRAEGLDEDDKTPVILTVSPYLNHSGATADFNPVAQGPSSRFYDFLELTRVLDRGYTYAMVDLPGFGGSGGCNDWGGPREQGAVKAAVEWAASQPWSTGRVALMGKSYDAWTGLMGIAQRPQGLAAVVAMEPVYAGYRYLYNDGVRFINSFVTGAGFQVYDAKPGSTRDAPMYHASGAPQAWCYGVNYSLQQQDDPESPFWVERDLLRTTTRSRIPLFLTQGFLETNTKPDGAFDFFNGLAGPNRAWFGQFDHYRGWEKEGRRFLMGRSAFVDEMMRFLDHHLKGIGRSPLATDPAVAVQDNLGRYRGEETWPPRDAQMWRNGLHVGDYVDDADNSGSGSGAGRGIWTVSQRLPHAVWLAGEPVVEVALTAVPRANLTVNLYDIDPSGTATLVSRGTHLVRAPSEEITLELYGQDWYFRPGHRIGALISSSNSEWWIHVPTMTTVSVDAARLRLPLLTFDRRDFLDGTSTSTLQEWLGERTFEVPDDVLSEAQKTFRLPPRLRG